MAVGFSPCLFVLTFYDVGKSGQVGALALPIKVTEILPVEVSASKIIC